MTRRAAALMAGLLARRRAELAGEPGSRYLPIAHDSLRRRFDHLCRFLDREPSEKPQLHDLCASWVEARKRLQGVIQPAQRLRGLGAACWKAIEVKRGGVICPWRSAAALFSKAFACRID